MSEIKTVKRKRLSPQAREITIKFLLERDKGICLGCKEKLPPVSEKGQIDLCHLDEDPSNNDPSNLALMHHSCNQRQRSMAIRELAKSAKVAAGMKAVCENKSASGEAPYFSVAQSTDAHSPTHETPVITADIMPSIALDRQRMNFSEVDPITINRVCEPQFRRWLIRYLQNTLINRSPDGTLRYEHATRNDILDRGAEVCRCSQTTIDRYLKKLLKHSTSFLEAYPHKKEICIRLRRADDYLTEEEQLYERYGL